MKNLLLLLSLTVSAGAQDFGAEGQALLHLPRLTAPPLTLDIAQKVHGQTLTRVCDEGTWAKLLAKARKSKNTQKIPLNGTTYTVYIITTQTPVKGQDCEAGAHAENSLFVAATAKGTGPDIYPVRFSAVCRDASGVRDSFSLDADINGNILNATIYNGSLGITTHPISEPVEPPSEVSTLSAFLSRLVNLFLETN